MALLAIRTVIQAPTIPCTQRTHKSRLYLLQAQENMTPGAKRALIKRISGDLFVVAREHELLEQKLNVD